MNSCFTNSVIRKARIHFHNLIGRPIVNTYTTVFNAILRRKPLSGSTKKRKIWGHSLHSKLTADLGIPQSPHETEQEQSQPPNPPQWL